MHFARSLAACAVLSTFGTLPALGGVVDSAHIYAVGRINNSGGSLAYAVSANGLWATGGSFGPVTGAFLWSEVTGNEFIGSLNPIAISSDGSVVAGTQGELWTRATGVVNISSGGEVADMSADGSTVITINGRYWTQSAGWRPTGLADARAVNANAQWIAGATSGGQAARWSPLLGTQLLAQPAGTSISLTKDISADGNVIVGQAQNGRAFRWQNGVGTSLLPILPGSDFSTYSANAVSANGNVIVGVALSSASGRTPVPWIWTAQLGIRSLAGFLSSRGASDVVDWTLTDVYGISDDGLSYVGFGGYQGGFAGFHAHVLAIPTPAAGLLFAVSSGLLAARRRRASSRD